MEVVLEIGISQFYHDEYVYDSNDLYQPITPYKNWMELVVNSINNLDEDEIYAIIVESENDTRDAKTIKDLCDKNKLEEKIVSVEFRPDYDCVIMAIFIEI